MKKVQLSLLLLSTLAIIFSFASCNEDPKIDWDYDSKTDLPSSRAFVLCEGVWGQNNSKLNYFNWANDVASEDDIYLVQNEKHIGDTAQDLITDGTYMYMSVNGSNYVCRMSKAGKEQARNSFIDKLGEVRYLCKCGDFLYATTYKGIVAKMDYKTLSFIDSVYVGDHPEGITELDNKLYVSVSGWGADSRVAEISLDNFTATPKYIDVMVNPNLIMTVNDKVYVQGYGPYDESWNCNYPWGVIENGKYRELGNATSWCSYENTIYLCLSQNDWVNNTVKNTFYTYDSETGKFSDENPLKNIPTVMASSAISGMDANPYTGQIYVITSLFERGNGHIYHFLRDGTYKSKIPVYGQSPKKIVFFD